MSNGIQVQKRDGSVEPLNLDKIHRMVEDACEGLGSGVSASQVEMNSGLQFYDKIKTQDIQEILVRSASDLIDLDHYNYQFVAARLLLYGLRKQLFGSNWLKNGFPHIAKQVQKCVNLGVYDSGIIDKYSREEWDKINSWIDHERDFLFTYAGVRQVLSLIHI